ncbi:hypothetical protein AAVH_35153 [Aphelenchoides avenae]|nr:hypothetical protein AAVH_35153 [Aphelenchus avenae]
MLVINVNASAVTYLFYGILGPQKEIDKIARHLNAVKRNDTDLYEIDCASRDTYRPIYFWFEKSVRLNPRDYNYYDPSDQRCLLGFLANTLVCDHPTNADTNMWILGSRFFNSYCLITSFEENRSPQVGFAPSTHD